MNLQENIQRIKEVMGLLKEEFDEIFDLSNEYNKEVEELQKFLKSKNYYIGSFGDNKDGIDGKYGKKTRSAHKAYLAGISADEYNLKKKVKSIEKTDDVVTDKVPSSSLSGDVILMGGLDNRSGDKNISQQVELLKSNMGGKNVIGHRYNDFSGVEKSILKNPDSYVVLFSAGCSHSSKIASLISDKSKLFIVEPFASSSNTASSVQNAVSKGVPSGNVIVGPSTARGAGVVSGATKTPSGTSHWGALKFVGSLIK
jgi:hypothetical protein